ncbi:hypothetical protein SteCoe_18566 [Stentor coeruleus]|uniref:Uncharacterized protein n=1 Tax=Stentor coeruleus TaxID=5963 RepID=A0A1R2BW62_9CILI|nr:hypothetical protein SteCoe_18566 [Stentor coeruleus]
MESSKKAEIFDIAKRVFKEQYHSVLALWIDSAKSDEIKGLKVINCVIKHKGKKKFRPLSNSTYSIPKNEEEIRQRTMTSFYKNDFCSEFHQIPTKTHLLEKQKLSEMKYSEILTREALIYLESWLSLKDNHIYLQYLLSCLKGIYSVITIHKGSLTTINRQDYEKFKMQPVLKYRQIYNKTPQKNDVKPELRLKDRPHTNSCTPFGNTTGKIFYEPVYYQDRMKRIMKGSGDILKWTYEKNVSSYQESFMGKTLTNMVAKPFKSSVVVKLLP